MTVHDRVPNALDRIELDRVRDDHPNSASVCPHQASAIPSRDLVSPLVRISILGVAVTT